jgi:hypothetical protein
MTWILKILFWVISIIYFLCHKNVFAQSKDSLQKKSNSINPIPQNITSQFNQNKIVSNYKPEIFTSGFIDIINNGQVNASARFIRLYVGEPGRFAIPLSIYSGVSSNNFSNGSLTGQNPYAFQRSNDVLVTNFINPLSGLANISIDGVQFFNKKEQATKTGCIYHFGERILTGIRTGPVGDPATGKPVKDLRKAIGINDRFLFVSELFRGDETMYERSIKTINNFSIYPEAEYWMNRELKVKLGWDDNKETVKQFYLLVKRRFS